jgi:hypothetical protein
MYFYKIATIVLASAVINLPRFALNAQIAPPIAVETSQAEAGTVSRMPLTNQAEMNDYLNASGQTDASAKVMAINAFLARYPASHAREDLLEQLMAVYVREPDMDKVTETAVRILSVDPKNLRALFYVTYVAKERALLASPKDARALLDNAASEAEIALDSPSKPDYLTPLEFQRLRVVTAPYFYSAIAIDDAAKRDYSGAIHYFTTELEAYLNSKATESGTGLDDTYRLAQAYEEQTPADLKNAAWFYTRAAQFASPETKPQWEKKAESTYLQYHGSLNGYLQTQALARANLLPPPEYNPPRAIT